MRKFAHLVAGESWWFPLSIAMAAVALTPSAAYATSKLDNIKSPAGVRAACPVIANIISPTPIDISRAILGGAPSALHRIRADQQAVAVEAPRATAAAPLAITAGVSAFPERMTLEPASRGPTRLGPNCNAPTIFAPFPGTSADYDTAAELGTRAIPVKRTRFDDRWDHVRRAAPAALMHGKLRRANVLPGLGEQELLARVNQWVNREIAYVNDDRNYRQRDFWATAEQTIARGRGDCEDFAILKMQMLRAAGVHPDRMKLVLLRDLAANADHAFLLVQTEAGKVVLDNVTDRLYDGSQANSVRPILSFSENRRWVHAYRGAQPSPNLIAIPASQKSYTLALRVSTP